MKKEKKNIVKKRRASVSVVALVTTIILLLLAVTLVNIVFFSLMNSERDAEVQRGRWFLEGRVQEYFGSVIAGKMGVKTGKFSFQEKIEGREEKYSLDIADKGNSYSLHAHMRWKNRYRVEQYVEFSRLNLFDYALYINGDRTINLQNNMLVVGDIGVNGKLTVHNRAGNQLYMMLPDHGYPRINYSSAPPDIKPFFFRANLKEIFITPYIQFNYDREDVSLAAVNKKRSMLANLKLPDFNAIWSSFYPYRDVSWTITDSSFYDTVAIANPLSTRKEMIAWGNGFSTRFNVDVPTVKNVYIKRVKSDQRFQNLDSLDYSYYYGVENKDKFFRYYQGVLNLVASSEPMPVLLPEESYRVYGRYYIAGDNWSMISRDERIADLYLETPHPSRQLIENVDYLFMPQEKSVRLLSEAFYSKHTVLLGTGDGFRTSFPLIRLGGRMYIYEGLERTTSFMSYGSTLVFEQPPAAQEPIYAMADPPPLYMRKAPPDDYSGVFIDVVDEAVVLDLSSMQNYPENGVVISTLPLLVKGEAPVPLVIVCAKNVYIENINPGGSGKPVLITSREGIWLYKDSKSTSQAALNKCVLYSPLNGLYTITDDGNWANYPINIYGTVVFSYENPEGAISLDLFEKNFIYYPGIRDYLREKPFSLFPLPVDIELIRRS